MGDSSRLTEADIQRMVDDAAKFAEEVQAKNSLESYAYSMKQTVEDTKFAEKISEEDKKVVADKVGEVIGWLDSNQTAEKDEFEHQKKELESICNPIMTKLHQAPQGASAPTAGGATVEEVD